MSAIHSPSRPADFIGGARKVGDILAAKAVRLRKADSGNLKALLYGPPGVGKTAVARMVAQSIGSPFSLEAVNGRSVSVALVQEWQRQAAYRSMFDGFTVRIVDELDTCPPAAQDLLLTFLDNLPDGWAFLGTSNLDLNQLVPRLQTRLQHFKVEAPVTSELTKFLRGVARVPETVAAQIAVGSAGNVRAALLDLESWQDVQHART